MHHKHFLNYCNNGLCNAEFTENNYMGTYAVSEALEIYMRGCANLLMAAICLISQSNSFVLVETFIET